MTRNRLLFVVVALLAAMLLNGCGSGSATKAVSNPGEVSVSVSSSSGSIEQEQTPVPILTATVTGDASEAGVTWAATCSASPCGTVTSSSPTTATYTPPSGALTASLSVTVTATSVSNTTKSASETITVVPAPSTPSSASAPATATINGNFNLPLVNANTGKPPFTLNITTASSAPRRVNGVRPVGYVIRTNASSGDCTTVPAWLMNLFNPETGAINGTVPGTATNFDCSVFVTDANQIKSPSVALSITVPVVLTAGTLPTGEQSETGYSATLAALAEGGSGAYTFSGTLPNGLTLAPGGAISGNIAANASNPLTFNATVTDSANVQASQSFSITVDPAVAISAPSPASLTAAIGANYSLTLSTGGTGIGPFTWTETSGNLSKVGLALSNGVISAASVPATATTQQIMLEVKDSANVTATLPATITVPIKIVTAALPGGEQTEPSYSSSLNAQGGTGSFTWSLASGSLPANLALAGNGAITGSVGAAATTQTFTVKATDSGNNSMTQQLTINISPQVAITPPAPGSLVANIGSGYSLGLATAAGTGVGPFNWTLASGSNLPAWLSLSSGGQLSANSVPTTALDAQFTVQVTDAANISATLPVSLTVPVKISNAPLPSGEQTESGYSATLSALGGSGGYTWSLGSGTPPAGLTLGGNGSITGNVDPAATTQTFTVNATDSSNVTANQQFTITINPLVAIATPPPANLVANIGSGYNLTLATTAGTGVGPFTWAVASGSSLPAWLSLSNGGVLSASSVPNTALDSQFTVKVTDSAGISNTLPLSLTVPIKISNTPLPSAEQTENGYSATLSAFGGSGGYTWSLATGTPPSGLTLNGNGSITGNVGAAATTQTFTVNATDSSNVTGSQQFTITINPQVAIAAPAPAGLTANIGSGYSLTLQTVAGTGVGPFTWSLAGAPSLPPWLTLSSGGVLSATSVPTTANTSQFTVKVTDSANISNTLALTVTVPIKILTASLSAGEVSVPYASATPAAEGGSGTYTWTASGLPALWASINPTTGVISGNPVAGTSNVTLIATDSLSASGSSPSIPLTIYPQVAITAMALPGGSYNVLYPPQALAATGGLTPYSNWQLSGNTSLPAGLKLDKNTGIISGTPACPVSTSNFMVTVQDSLNVTSAAQNFSITTSTAPLAITTTSIPSDPVGIPYSQQLQSTGGACNATITWSATGLPGDNWLTLSPSGLLSGTPNGAADLGPTTFTVQATDGVTTVQQMLTISVIGGHSVSGQVTLTNGGAALAGAVVSLDGGPSATTDSNGDYTIQNVVSGTYSASVLFAGAPSSAFFPASRNVTVTNSDVTGVNFTAALGYTISGKVTYAGNHFHGGQVYISLVNSSCTSCQPIQGTNVLPPENGDPTAVPPRHESFTEPFVINGVPPGTYTVSAWMDFARYGVPNAYDPAGTGGPVTVTVGNGNITNVPVSLLDPVAAGDLSSWSNTSISFSPMESGVILQYKPVVVNGVEQALLYGLQWSASDNGTCQTAPDGGMYIDPSNNAFNPIVAGTGRIVILDSNNFENPNPSFENYFNDTQTYYFCMQPYAINPTTQTLTRGGFQFANGNLGVTVGPPTGKNTVSGSVTIPDSVNVTGPLYAGCFDEKGGQVYSAPFENPVTASDGVNSYSVSGVPTGASCFIFAMLDQNADGFITPVGPNPSLYIPPPPQGDIYNINPPNPTLVTVSGSLLNQDVDLTPFTGNSNAILGTQHVQHVDLSNTTQESYNLNLTVTPLTELPVGVTVLSGPNVITPMDLAVCSTCGETTEFSVSLATNGVRPQVGDTYVIQVDYPTDLSLPPDILTLTVTGVNDAFVTSTTPSGHAPGTTPTFRWADPANASNYGYQFSLWDSNGNTIWQIPGSGAPTDFFTSSITSVPWSTTVDPLGAKNPPSVTSLTSGATYTWSVTVQDSNLNSAIKQVMFIP